MILNKALDNILLKITEYSDGQEMLISLVQVLFDGKKHSMVVMKCLLIFSKIFTRVQENQAKYLQGSLYAIGALLKVETRSYLVSTGKSDIISEDCKQEEERHFEVRIRDMSQREINFFEKETHQALCNFIDTMLNVKDIKSGISLNTMKLHKDLIQEDFLEEYDEYNKKDHKGLMRTESANLALLFLFDLLQFFYQFLSQTIQKPLENIEGLGEGKDKYLRLHNIVPAYLNHQFKYTVGDSVNLVKSILKAIKTICPSPSHLLELWHLRRHIEVLTNITTEDEVREDQNYERTDKFNSVGLLMYVYWSLKARINCSVDENYRHTRFEEIEGFESPLPETVTREFEFEILYPLIANAVKDKVSYTVVYDVAIEILSYYCRVLNPKLLQFPGCKVAAAGNGSQNYKWLLQALFEYIGSNSGSEEKRKITLELFKKLIDLYDALTMEDIVFDMIIESRNDKEKALLIDIYKGVLLKAYKEDNQKESLIAVFKDHLRLMLDYHFETEKEYIFDITERMISTLNLWRSLYLIEKQRSEISETAKKLHEKVTKKICDDVAKLIDTLQPGLEKDREHALNNPNLQEGNRKIMEQTWNSNFSKLDILREVMSIIKTI